jgi:hypothetical protein
LHFSQGDGEISFCGAIEMAGVITIKFSVMKNGMEQLAMKSPIYIPGPVEPQFGPGRYIYFEGFSVDEHGKQHYLDTTIAYRQTSLRVIEYLRRYGMSFLFTHATWKKYHPNTSTQATTTIKFTCCSLALPCRGMWLVLWIFLMRAPPWDCQWTSSTLISRLTYLPRNGIWEAAHLLVHSALPCRLMRLTICILYKPQFAIISPRWCTVSIEVVRLSICSGYLTSWSN